MSKFVYDTDFPTLVLADIQPYLERYEWLIPGWCSKVLVGWRAENQEGGNAVLQCDVHYEYRWARVTVFGIWIDQDPRSKPDLIIHELLHITVEPLHEWVYAKLGLLLKDDIRLRDSLRQDERDISESVVQDLADNIRRGGLQVFPSQGGVIIGQPVNGGVQHVKGEQS